MAMVSDALRKAMESSGLTRYAISRATGISESALSRFAHGGPMRGPNIDALADYLGLELTAKRRRAAKGR